ncbi:transmembrane protein 40 isoform X5 [Panthera pardus]|uniref:Transmembrane protein 40 isoform X5 n=2 Tax=Panthera TaxID=9688 RepID=A0A9V1EUN3_PANPR|nr:transmembrane protein 40 isoform X5 [Panthera pardus]
MAARAPPPPPRGAGCAHRTEIAAPAPPWWRCARAWAGAAAAGGKGPVRGSMVCSRTPATALCMAQTDLHTSRDGELTTFHRHSSNKSCYCGSNQPKHFHPHPTPHVACLRIRQELKSVPSHQVPCVLSPIFRPQGKTMETSGPSSQTQDHSRVPGETEDLDWSSDEDQHPRVTGKRRQSQGAGHPPRDSSPGAVHEEPDLLKDELQLYGGVPGEVVPSGESGLRRRGSDPASGEVEASQLRRLNIKKDDEFFHFVLLCFAIGTLLVCYHYYADWFMSLGVGLLTFASLETVGIYFGLVYRIHSVLHGFIPLLQKLRLMASPHQQHVFRSGFACQEQ